MPFLSTRLVAPVCPEAKLRKLVKNMIYVGVVAQLLGIDMEEVEKALRKQFAKKAKAAESESGRASRPATTMPRRSLTKQDPYLHRAHGQDPGQDHHRRQLRVRRWAACSPA